MKLRTTLFENGDFAHCLDEVTGAKFAMMLVGEPINLVSGLFSGKTVHRLLNLLPDGFSVTLTNSQNSNLYCTLKKTDDLLSVVDGLTGSSEISVTESHLGAPFFKIQSGESSMIFDRVAVTPGNHVDTEPNNFLQEGDSLNFSLTSFDQAMDRITIGARFTISNGKSVYSLEKKETGFILYNFEDETQKRTESSGVASLKIINRGEKKGLIHQSTNFPLLFDSMPKNATLTIDVIDTAPRRNFFKKQ